MVLAPDKHWQAGRWPALLRRAAFQTKKILTINLISADLEPFQVDDGRLLECGCPTRTASAALLNVLNCVET